MPDTIRSLSELNALLADNDSGGITPQDLRDMMISQMVYAEIGSGQKGAITLAAGQNVLDLNVAGAINRGLTVDTANKWIADVPVDMKAEVTFEILFQGLNNTTFNFNIIRNPGASPVQIARLDSSCRIFNAAMIGSVCVSAYVQLTEGDKLQARVQAGAVSFTLLRGGMRVRRIGVE